MIEPIDITDGFEKPHRNTPWFPSFISFLILYFISHIGLWKIFTKAGETAWPAFIPIVDIIVLLKIIRKPCWWTVLAFIPIVNFIVHVIVMCHLADCFQRSTGFKIGLIFLPVIFLLILGFDDSKYTPPTDEEIDFIKH